MAMDILLQRGVVHEANHDVESFIWVFSFCVKRNILIRAFDDPQSEVREQCTEFFLQPSPKLLSRKLQR